MASHTSALKAHRQSLENRERSRQYRSRLRTVLKSMRAALARGDADAARTSMADTASLIDKLVGKGIIHANAAGRYKSRLMRRLSRLSAPA